jgi:predicted nuclease of predicted toxin-antitoxin system
MRLLADENVPLPSIFALRTAGMDVAAATEDAAGASDREVLARAQREGRVLLTFDRDFGEHVFREGASGEPGVIYCRFIPTTPLETAEVLVRLAVETGIAFEGHFTVIDRDQVRRRRLPGRITP